MTKSWTVSYRYKTGPECPWIYDTTKTQAKSYAEAKTRVVGRLRQELHAWEIEL